MRLDPFIKGIFIVARLFFLHFWPRTTWIVVRADNATPFSIWAFWIEPLETQVADTREVLGWILSFGSGAQVLKPDHLQQAVKEEARKLLAQ